MSTVFETERLIVRAWTMSESDVDRVYSIYSDWSVARWLGPTPRVMVDRGDALAVIERWRARQEADPRLGAWAAEVRETGVVAGTILTNLLPYTDGSPPSEVEIGWHLHPDSWGHGYATEGARGAAERAFAKGVPTVYATVYPENVASLAVCRRLGMTPLGRTNRFYGMEAEAFRWDAGERRSEAVEHSRPE
jgi:RimJ/RimL family protein N-acetyltransferase